MSYIPKYILKRMLPPDCVKKVEGGFTINMVNVISPLSIDDGIPDDPWNHVSLKIDGVDIDVEQKKKVTLEFDGNKYLVEKAKDFEGKVIPVGEKVSIFVPKELDAGSEHDFEVVIQTDNPFQIKVTRSVN